MIEGYNATQHWISSYLHGIKSPNLYSTSTEVRYCSDDDSNVKNRLATVTSAPSQSETATYIRSSKVPVHNGWETHFLHRNIIEKHRRRHSDIK